MMKNCTTLAFKLETAEDPVYKGQSDEEIFESISEMASKHNRKVRQLENDQSSLKDGEWMVAFIGFWDFKEIRFGFYFMHHDYHFALKQNDGTWLERERSNNDEVSITSLKQLNDFAEHEGLKCHFYAVSKTTNKMDNA